ncbi:hypothetical protein QBC44DRAFT_382023 [Cladorrhinum sp. PSN332]|nr:hypothetical protein QBC44DRAFT_382023 [Cladorrhinum sp. PSN332]
MDLAIFRAPVDSAVWPILGRINSQFLERLPPNAKTPRCVACGNQLGIGWFSKSTTRSTLWRSIRCGSGHGQTLYIYDPNSPESHGGLCYRCDQFLLNALLNGKCRCLRAGCRQLVRINETALRTKILDGPDMRRVLAMIEGSERYECIIHLDMVKYTTNNKPPSPNCKHDQNVCHSCLRTDFEKKIQRNSLEAFTCPDLNCREKVPGNRVREVIGIKCRKVYGKKLALLLATQTPNFQWCRCGRAAQIGDDSPVWRCTNNKCGHLNCRTCGDMALDNCSHMRAFDETMRKKWDKMRDSAKQAVERKRIELREKKKATEELMAKITKLCPKKYCGIRIERKSGCAHMTCPSCRSEFCWACKVIWVQGIRHLDTCPMARVRKIGLSQLDKRHYADGWQDDGRYDTSRDGPGSLYVAYQDQ